MTTQSLPLAISVEWVLLPVFSALTGYSVKAAQRKIADGVWVQGIHYRKAPDGRIHMNMPRYYQWVEGAQVAA